MLISITKSSARPWIGWPFLEIVMVFCDAFPDISVITISSPKAGEDGNVRVIAPEASIR